MVSVIYCGCTLYDLKLVAGLVETRHWFNRLR